MCKSICCPNNWRVRGSNPMSYFQCAFNYTSPTKQLKSHISEICITTLACTGWHIRLLANLPLTSKQKFLLAWPGQDRQKWNFCFEISGRFATSCCVTLYTKPKETTSRRRKNIANQWVFVKWLVRLGSMKINVSINVAAGCYGSYLYCYFHIIMAFHSHLSSLYTKYWFCRHISVCPLLLLSSRGRTRSI